MKLISFVIDGRASYGVVKGQGVVDLGRWLGPQGCTTLRQLLAADQLKEAEMLGASESADYPLDRIQFAPVIPDPYKIICVGLNYRDHVAETGQTVTEKPALFVRFAGSQVGHLQPIIRPKASDNFEYEGELALVIGEVAAISLRRTRCRMWRAMLATTKAAFATGNGIQHSSCRARPSRNRVVRTLARNR